MSIKKKVDFRQLFIRDDSTIAGHSSTKIKVLF